MACLGVSSTRSGLVLMARNGKADNEWFKNLPINARRRRGSSETDAGRLKEIAKISKTWLPCSGVTSIEPTLAICQR